MTLKHQLMLVEFNPPIHRLLTYC